MSEAIKNKFDFVAFVEVINGNPNGDPDTGNMPRVDPETGVGLITDVCIKRKIRNFVDTTKSGDPNYDIYIKQGIPLNAKDASAFKENGFNVKEDGSDVESVVKKEKNDKLEIAKKVRASLCNRYFDIRAFGAVITSFSKAQLNGGQIRGPVQMGFARSIDPVFPHDITITRCAVTTAKDAETKVNTMGNKSIVSYGLYRLEGYVSANLAEQTGFSEEDIRLLWNAIINMCEDDHSASRGNMAVRKLVVFKHQSKYGDCPSYKLFEAVRANRKDLSRVARSFSDYEIRIERSNIPQTVIIEEW